MRVVWAPAPIGQQPAGPQVYSTALARALARLSPDDVFRVFYDGRQATTEAHRFGELLGQQPNVASAVLPVPLRVARLADRIRLPLRRWATGPFDIYHQFHLEADPLVGDRHLILTVHDTVAFELAGESPPFAGVEALVRRAAAIVTCSEYSKQRLLALFPGLDRVCVVPNGTRMLDVAPRPLTPSDNHDKYFLYVGGQTPRKNIPRLIEGFCEFIGTVDCNHKLVLAGPLNPLNPDVQAAIARGPAARIRVAGYVNDEQLIALYAGAEALVIPSLYEGFGLPALDAMALGTRVITSRASAMEETTADTAVLIDPLDPRDIADGMRRVFEEAPEVRANRIAAGLSRAQLFSWDRAAAGYLSVYRQVLASSKQPPLTVDRG